MEKVAASLSNEGRAAPPAFDPDNPGAIDAFYADAQGGPCPYFEDEHYEKLNAESTYTFTVPATHPDAAAIVEQGSVVIRDTDDTPRMFRIRRPADANANGITTRKVFCEGAHFDLNGYPSRLTSWTAKKLSEIAADVLAGSGWQVGTVSVDGVYTWALTESGTAMSAIRALGTLAGLDQSFRVEIDDTGVTGRFVDFTTLGVPGKTFEYGRDLAGVTRTSDSIPLATAIIGEGKADDKTGPLKFTTTVWTKSGGAPVDKPAGQDWVGDEAARLAYGPLGDDGQPRHIYKTLSLPDLTTGDALLQACYDELVRVKDPACTYEVDAVFLERFPDQQGMQADDERVHLGDTVTVRDTTFTPPLVVSQRVVELTRSYASVTGDKGAY